MRRAAAIAGLLAAWAAVPADAPARPAKKCAKRMHCKGKLRGVRAGVPVSWSKRTARPADPAAPGDAPQPPVPGGGGTPGGGGGPPPPPPPPPPLPAEDPSFVQVTAYDADAEWFLVPSRTALAAGAVTVEFNNRHAADPHNLKLRLGTTVHEFATLEKGDAATRQLPLAAGRWKLWCDIGDHEARGMVAYVTVG